MKLLTMPQGWCLVVTQISRAADHDTVVMLVLMLLLVLMLTRATYHATVGPFLIQIITSIVLLLTKRRAT